MCSALFCAPPSVCFLSSHPVLCHPPPDFLHLYFAAVSEMREKAEQEAGALCGDSASQSDKIAVIFFVQNQHSVCVFPISTLTPVAFLLLLMLYCLFILDFTGCVKCQTTEWDPPLSFSPPVILSLKVCFKCKVRYPVMFSVWQ